MTDRMPELGFYALAGAPQSPAELLDEVRDGEAMGLGTAFISERYNIKEAVTLSGAAAAVTSEIQIATAATNHNTRHPMVTASYATTMHRLTGGRFTPRARVGASPRCRTLYGIPRITTAQMEDFAGLMRRLWHGEVVIGHDGPAGSWPVLHLDADVRRGHPARCSSPSAPTRWRSAGGRSTRSSSTPSSPTRPSPAACGR